MAAAQSDQHRARHHRARHHHACCVRLKPRARVWTCVTSVRPSVAWQSHDQGPDHEPLGQSRWQLFTLCATFSPASLCPPSFARSPIHSRVRCHPSHDCVLIPASVPALSILQPTCPQPRQHQPPDSAPPPHTVPACRQGRSGMTVKMHAASAAAAAACADHVGVTWRIMTLDQPRWRWSI